MKKGKFFSCIMVSVSLVIAFFKMWRTREERRLDRNFTRYWPTLDPYRSFGEKKLAVRLAKGVDKAVGWGDATPEQMLAPTSKLIQGLPEIEKG